MLAAVFIAIGLVGGIATWAVVVSALRRLHRTQSPAAQQQTAHQVRLLVVLGLLGFAITFAMYTMLLHLFGVADDTSAGFFWFFLAIAISMAPVTTVAVVYGRRRQAGSPEHHRTDESV